jgi:hypothetical protein
MNKTYGVQSMSLINNTWFAEGGIVFIQTFLCQRSVFAQAVPAAMQILCVGGGILGRSYVWLLQSGRDLMSLISALSDVRLETALDDSHALARYVANFMSEL